jgi:hypothetical protein
MLRSDRELDDPPTPAEMEELAAAAQRAIAAYKAGRISQAEMHRRFWQCIGQLPPLSTDVSPGAESDHRDDAPGERPVGACGGTE